LRRECHIQNIIEAHRNSAPILITIRCDLTFVGQVQSLDVLGWGSTPLGVLSKITQTLHSRIIRVSLTCQSHLNLTRMSSSLSSSPQIPTTSSRANSLSVPAQHLRNIQDRLTQRDCVGARTVGAKRHVVTQHMGRSIGCTTCSY
jgi:hypothetical protein